MPNAQRLRLILPLQDAGNHAVASVVTVAVSDSLLQNQEPCTAANLRIPYTTHRDGFADSKNCFSDGGDWSYDDGEEQHLPCAYHRQQAGFNSNRRRTVAYQGQVAYWEKTEPAADKFLTLFSSSGNNGVFLTDNKRIKPFSFPLEVYPDSTQFAVEVKDLANHMLYNTKLALRPHPLPAV